MVVTELDLVRIAVSEPEADAPLIVDGDGMLPGAIAFQCKTALLTGDRRRT